jgi:hypothetical protein
MQPQDPEPEVDLRCRCGLHVRVKVLLVGVALVAIGAFLALGLWSRRGGLNDSVARRRPEGYQQKRWPTSAVGWVVLVLLGALAVGMFIVWIETRGVLAAVVTFVGLALGIPLLRRWARGGRANW